MKRFTIFKAVFVSAVLSLLCMMSVTAAGDDPKRDIILTIEGPSGEYEGVFSVR